MSVCICTAYEQAVIGMIAHNLSLFNNFFWDYHFDVNPCSQAHN